jgi:carbon-monoxide dehydrogenase small subunit
VSTIAVSVTVNGRAHERTVESRLTLADFIRDELSLTGTHLGCEHGICGSCTVLVDDEPVRSCLMLAAQADGSEVTTVEGLNERGALDRLHRAFAEAHALQCGFCTPGILVTAHAFLKRNPNPTLDEARQAIAGNLCRCTGYAGIVEAVTRAGAP